MYKKKNFKVAIIGLGYVGLPLYLLCLQKKIDVVGYDLNSKKIDQLKNNSSYIVDVKNSDLKKYESKKLFTMGKIRNINDRNLIIFCLPTPILKNKDPDMSYIKKALISMKDYISDDTFLILESTVYPGATREILGSFIEFKLKKKTGIEYGFSSERISPGQNDKRKFKINYNSIPKVISGSSKKALNFINSFYKILFKKTHKVKSIEIAEMSKLLENSYRAVNIGLVNEFKILCKHNNINIHDVITAASTKPFGYNPFEPGPGVGGHCIPIDPLFVSWYAKNNGLSADFIELARKENIEITNWVVRKIFKIIRDLKFKKVKILVLGVAYKQDVNDTRESPALKIMNKLRKYKVKLNYFDPFIPNIFINKKKFISLKNLNSISSYDIVILTTNHSNLPFKKILDKSKILIDTRGQYKNSINKNLHYL